LSFQQTTTADRFSQSLVGGYFSSLSTSTVDVVFFVIVVDLFLLTAVLNQTFVDTIH